MPEKTTTTFRICRRTLNRGGFGHREYYLISREGVLFKAQRIYDLPMNGEIEVPIEDSERQIWSWASCGFEVPERIQRDGKDAPQAVIDEAFKPKAVQCDLNALVMG